MIKNMQNRQNTALKMNDFSLFCPFPWGLLCWNESEAGWPRSGFNTACLHVSSLSPPCMVFINKFCQIKAN